MEPETQIEQPKKFGQLHKVTPFSKYLAILLFIAMPFIGGWIGYEYALEKKVETFIYKEVVKETEKCLLSDMRSGIATYGEETEWMSEFSDTESPFIVNEDGVFYDLPSHGDYSEPEKIHAVNPNTFEYLGHHYARDGNYLFYGNEILSVLSNYDYDEDYFDLKVFYRKPSRSNAKLSSGKTLDTFGGSYLVIMEDYSNIYFLGVSLDGLDSTYEVDSTGAFIFDDDTVYKYRSTGIKFSVEPSSCEEFREYKSLVSKES